MKKRKWNKIRMFFGILLIGIVLQTEIAQVCAEDMYDPEQGGSITVTLDDLETERSQVSLACYRVGNVVVNDGNLEGFQAEKGFESLGLDFSDLEDTDKHEKAVGKLEKFLKENPHIQPVQQKETDAAGRCSFPQLDQGIYLIVQENGFSTYGTIQSFLVGIPYMEENILLYDVSTETKGERPADNPEEPTEEETAKTGDSSQTGMMFGLACLSFAALLFTVSKIRK